MRRLIVLLLVFMCVTMYADNLAPRSIDEKCVTFRVMQFNVLQGWDSYNASETVGHEWLNRREAVVRMFQDTDPDIVCVQEARKLQCSYLKEQLPQYSQVLYPKDGIETNGGQRDLIMYKSSKFELLQWDKFWFSVTPDHSSYSWDAGTPKLTIRAQFKCLEGMPKTFWIYCTHFFPQGDSCRQICSNMMVADMKANIGPDEPVFLCGDLNLNYGDVRLDTLLTYMGDAATSAPESDGPLVCTYSAFNPNYTKTLDHIYGRNVYFKTYRVVNDKTKYGVEYISDHFPLYADVQLPSKWEDEASYGSYEDIVLTNKWIRAEKSPYANIYMSQAASYKRGFCRQGNVLYAIARNGNSSSASGFLDRFDAESGIFLDRLPLSSNLQTKTYPCNDVIKDEAGNILVYNYSLSVSSVAVKLFMIDVQTGEATLKAEIKSKNGAAKVEHLTVTGDVSKGNFDIYIPASSSTKVLKFTFKDGVQSSEEMYTLTEFAPSTVTKLGASPRLLPVGDGKCIINSSTTLPSLYDLTTGKIVSSIDKVVNNKEKLVPPTTQLAANGFATFLLRGKRYVVYPVADHASSQGYQFVVSTIDDKMDFSAMNYLWTLPQDGLGTVNNTNSEALVECHVNAAADSAYIYLYVPGNALACYVLTDKSTVSVKSVTAKSEELEMVCESRNLKLSRVVDQVDIYDTTGKRVLSGRYLSVLNMQALSGGLYVVKVSVEGKSLSRKIWIR